MRVWLKTWKEANNNRDRLFVDFIARHSDLVMMLSAAILLVWAVVTSQWLYVGAVIVVGGFSFFLGFVESIVLAGAFLIYAVWSHLPSHLDAATILMEVFGMGCVAWLGFRHREAQRQERERVRQETLVESVMPWAVTNEIRTSLAAIRYLLFPYSEKIGTGESIPSITKATDELQRIEKLFYEYEQARAVPDHDK
ncbi:MAG: hypothetical protein OWT28_00840 [Firmicutes bacterium]|nr:hypothetical protein [Bacillota bacterium]